DGGRAAIVLPDGILYRTETAFSTVRRRLINEFNLPAFVRLPPAWFPPPPATRPNLFFFSRAGRPEATPSSQRPFPPGKRSYSKLNPLTRDVLGSVEHWLINGEADDYSWKVDYETLVERGFDLDIPWPNASQITGAETAGEQLKGLLHQLGILNELTE